MSFFFSDLFQINKATSNGAFVCVYGHQEFTSDSATDLYINYAVIKMIQPEILDLLIGFTVMLTSLYNMYPLAPLQYTVKTGLH